MLIKVPDLESRCPESSSESVAVVIATAQGRVDNGRKILFSKDGPPGVPKRM